MINSNNRPSDIENEREELIKLYMKEFGYISEDINKSISYSIFELESNKIECKNIIK